MQTFSITGTKQEVLSSLYEKMLFEEAGLTMVGKDEDGLQYMGTKEQWSKASKLSVIK